MNRIAGAFALGIVTLASFLAMGSFRAMPRWVEADGTRLRMCIAGKAPVTVIFDSFGPANLELWNRIQPQVAAFARTVSFDHGGHWGSEPGSRPRDARQLARELRAALRSASISPPYVLVGYSMGGPYARVFASTYPEEVCGLVLVDPTQEAFMDWFGRRFPEWVRISAAHREAQDELASVPDSLAQAQDAVLPAVPITLITGIKPYDTLTHAVLPRWLAAHQAWLTQYPGARHLITTNSGHDVALKEPELVIDAIREILSRRANPGR